MDTLYFSESPFALDFINQYDSLLKADSIFTGLTILTPDILVKYLPLEGLDSAVYKEMISAQHDTYYLIIMVILAIFTVGAAATWFFHYKQSKKEIKKLVTNEIEELKPEILNNIKSNVDNELTIQNKKFNRELLILKSEKSRLFAIINIDKFDIDNTNVDALLWAIDWMCSSLQSVIKLNNKHAIRKRTNTILEYTKELTELSEDLKEEFIKSFLNSDKDMKCIWENINKIPKLLDEKKIEIIDNFKSVFDDNIVEEAMRKTSLGQPPE